MWVDCELGQVSFYNMNSKLHIYNFPDMLTEKLGPYFSTDLYSNSFTICKITSEQ